jgi:hypothetical protein
MTDGQFAAKLGLLQSHLFPTRAARSEPRMIQSFSEHFPVVNRVPAHPGQVSVGAGNAAQVVGVPML